MSSTNAAHETTRSICSRNICLRIFLTFRLSYILACFIEVIFSGWSHCKYTVGKVMQSVLKPPSSLTLGQLQNTKKQVFIFNEKRYLN